MRPEIQISRNTLTADLFLSLYSAVGWEAPCRAQVERALAHTWAAFTASIAGAPVGMVRLLGDGGMSFYLKDFAVLPACQGQGAFACGAGGHSVRHSSGLGGESGTHQHADGRGLLPPAGL